MSAVVEKRRKKKKAFKVQHHPALSKVRDDQFSSRSRSPSALEGQYFHSARALEKQASGQRCVSKFEVEFFFAASPNVPVLLAVDHAIFSN